MKRGGDPVDAALWRAYRRGRTIEARNALVESYLYLVERVILSKWGRRMKAEGNYVSLEELRGYGVVGLIRGIEGYDPKKGTAPETWLSSRIYWAVLNGLREYDPLKQLDRARVKRGEMVEPKIASPLAMSQIGARREEISTAGSAPEYATDEDCSEMLKRIFGGRSERDAVALVMLCLEGASLRDAYAVSRRRPWGIKVEVPKWLRTLSKNFLSSPG